MLGGRRRYGDATLKGVKPINGAIGALEEHITKSGHRMRLESS